MAINVKNQVRVKDGQSHKVLLPSKNPHDVSAKVEADLVKAGLATKASGDAKAKTAAKAGSPDATKASGGTSTETGGGSATEGGE